MFLLVDQDGDGEDVYGEVRGERSDNSDEDMSDGEPILGKYNVSPHNL